MTRCCGKDANYLLTYSSAFDVELFCNKCGGSKDNIKDVFEKENIKFEKEET
jgi:hypothetical protein